MSRALARGSRDRESVAQTRSATEGCLGGCRRRAAGGARDVLVRSRACARNREAERAKRGCAAWQKALRATLRRGLSSRSREGTWAGTTRKARCRAHQQREKVRPEKRDAAARHGSIRQLTRSIRIENRGEGRPTPTPVSGPVPGPVPGRGAREKL